MGHNISAIIVHDSFDYEILRQFNLPVKDEFISVGLDLIQTFDDYFEKYLN